MHHSHALRALLLNMYTTPTRFAHVYEKVRPHEREATQNHCVSNTIGGGSEPSCGKEHRSYVFRILAGKRGGSRRKEKKKAEIGDRVFFDALSHKNFLYKAS